RHLHDAALPRAELVGADPEPVRARGDVAAVARDDEAREVVDGAAGTDRHPWRAPTHVVNDTREDAADARVERVAVAARRRVGRDELGGEAPDAERHARAPAQSRGVADRHLDAAAADVDAEGGRGLEH